MITKVHFDMFTAFEKLEIDNCSPGVNIFIGTNGTGKTHILKSIYASCDITKGKKSFSKKIKKVFLPSQEELGRLVHRSKASTTGFVEIHRRIASKSQETNKFKEISIRLSLSKSSEKTKLSGAPRSWKNNPLESVYIPVKEMLSNAPGFRSLYSLRNIHFEEVYSDIIDRAFLNPLKNSNDEKRKRLLDILQKAMDGKVTKSNEEFFLRNKQGKLEFTLLAEGLRKLGLLWLLIQNGTLLNGSILCWDEPEANLNPRLMKTIVEILLKLQRMGVQIFIATHDYVLLKEFDLQTKNNDKVLFHALYRDKETDKISVKSTPDYLKIDPNAIDDTFADLINRDIDRSMGSDGK